jgi:excisionase family DNA binding protein
MAISTVTDWDELPVLLNMRHVIDVTGVSRDTAFRLVHQRGFPSVRVGKQIRVPKDGFRRWLEEQTTTDEDEIK